jgi:hypothetical protein
VRSLWKEHRDVKGKRKKNEREIGEGGGVCTGGIKGKERRKREMGEKGFERERVKKMKWMGVGTSKIDGLGYQ